MSGGPAVLRTVDLAAGYGDVNVLDGVSIEVRPRTMVTIVGPNGAGKSTLLRSIYGLVQPRAGRVLLGIDGVERDVTGLTPNRLTALGLNYVPQLANVFPNMTVRENLELGCCLAPDRFPHRVERIAQWFPTLPARLRQRAGTLSGGERGMLALARALMSEPSVLLLDEPSAGLAPAVVEEVFGRIAAIKDQGISVVLVEQNARRSLAVSDYGYVLDTGRNRFEGPGRRLLDDPVIVELYLGRARLDGTG